MIVRINGIGVYVEVIEDFRDYLDDDLYKAIQLWSDSRCEAAYQSGYEEGYVAASLIFEEE